MRKLIFTVALAACGAVVNAQADSATFYLNKGLEEKAKGRKLEYLKQTEKAYQFNKTDKAVVSELAAAYYDLRRYGQARETYLQLEKLGDQSANTYKQLMLLSFNMRQFEDAVKYANLLKKKDPAEKVSFYMAKAHYELENFGEAIKQFNQALKDDPQNAEIPYQMARVYADMMDYKQAIAHFQKALVLDPNQNRWIYEMALMYYGMQDDQNSLKYMLEAAEKGYKKDNEYLENLATAYINTGKRKEGLAILTEALERRPNDLNLLNTIAQTYYDLKMWDEAIKYWDRALTVDKEDARALYMIGMSYQAKGDKQKGRAICDKAIQMDPSLKNNKQQVGSPAM